MALNSLGQHEEALKKIKIAVKLDPKQPGYWVNYGETLDAMGKKEEAEQKFHKARSLSKKP